MRSDQDVGRTIGDVMPGEPGIIRFLDTVWADRSGTHDDLATPALATAWLVRVGHTELPGLTSDEASDLRNLRDALRRLAAHQTEDPRGRAESPLALDDAVELINSIAGAPTPGPQIVVNGPATFESAPQGSRDVEDVLRVLASEGVEALTTPDALSLRACLAPSCILYYVQDHPRRAWCSAACGNRARAARHYARTKS
jgi:predicted RNA-binding Zn ribbon-like protein